MATTDVDIRQAAIQLSPAHRPTLNLRNREVAVERLSQCSNLSWCTGETLSSVPHTAGSCVGALLLVLFLRCLCLKWRKYKGTHPVASHYASCGAAAYSRVASRVGKVYRKKKRSLEKKCFRIKLWCVVYYYLAYGKATRVRYKVTSRLLSLVDRLKTAYLEMAICVYHYAPIVKVSALVIFLSIILSGDIELNPGPKHGFLRLSDMDNVQATLWDARPKWYNSGIQLKIEISDLDSIKVSNMGNPDECFTHLLIQWLRRRSPPPTWSAIVKALRSPTVGYSHMADKIQYGDSDTETEQAGVHHPSTMDQGASETAVGKCKQVFQSVKKIETLSLQEKDQLEGMLMTDSENIQLSFHTLCNKFFDSLESSKVPLKKLVHYLKGLKALKRLSSPKTLAAVQNYEYILENVTDFDGVRQIIEENSTFFDFRPIEYMINLAGQESDRMQLEKYKTDFEHYIERRIFVCPADFVPTDAPRSTKMIVKVEHDYDQLVELKRFQCQLSVILDVSIHVLRLCSVKEGCIQLLFVIPAFIKEAIFPLSAEQVAELKEVGVIKLSCGDYQFSDLDSSDDDDDSYFDEPSSGTGRSVNDVNVKEGGSVDHDSGLGTSKLRSDDTQSVEVSLDTFEDLDETYTSDNASLKALVIAANTRGCMYIWDNPHSRERDNKC